MHTYIHTYSIHIHSPRLRAVTVDLVHGRPAAEGPGGRGLRKITMLAYTILYFTILCYAILYYTILYYTRLCYNI